MPGKYVKKVVKKTTYKKKAPMAKGGGALAALTRKVNAIARSTSGTQSKVMYQFNASNVILGNALGSGYDVTNLSKFGTWSRCFGTDADDEQGKKAIIKNSNIQWWVNTQEADATGFSMFCVSLKKIASDLIGATGDLAALTSGTHYVGNGGRVLLNMNYFNIHYVKRWQMGSEVQARAALGAAPAVQGVPTETASLQKTGRFNLTYGKYGMAVQNPAGDWKAPGHPKADTQNYFLLTFSDNSTADSANPFMTHNQLHTVLVSA